MGQGHFWKMSKRKPCFLGDGFPYSLALFLGQSPVFCDLSLSNVQVKVGSKEKKTEVVEGNLSPVFKKATSQFTFDVRQLLSRAYILSLRTCT